MRNNTEKPTIVLIVPTYKPGGIWKEWLDNLIIQNLRPDAIINIDSSSSDGTKELSIRNGLEVLEIPKKDFNHAGTRNHAALYAKRKYDADILVFLTQDAILATKESIAKIIAPFSDPEVMAVCGRQLPHSWADPIAIHSRVFSYKDKSFINSIDDIPVKGLKAAYMSNSFAAYRYSAFRECGGFPEGLIFGEDMYLAAKMILRGHKTYYAAEATVYHSHNYSSKQEFKRYFDIGIFHSSQPFLLKEFGKPSGQGFKFAISELRYCLGKGGIRWMLKSVLHTLSKFMGYRLGHLHLSFPGWLNKMLSMDKNYWKK